MSRRTSAWRRLLPGKASHYIRYAQEEIQWGDLLIIWCRVSGRTQQRGNNLADQEAKLRQYAESRGAIVVGVQHHRGLGWDTYALEIAAGMASRYGAKVLAESTDRLVRSPHYHSNNNFYAQARVVDLEDLKLLGVTFATVLHPDALPCEAKSCHIKRGQWAKGRKGGRPKKSKPGYIKRRRAEQRPVALSMRWEGASLAQIAEKLRVPRSTIQDWINA